MQIRLPEVAKDLVAFPATSRHGVKKREVPVTDNYWVLSPNYQVPPWIFGRERNNFNMEGKIIMDCKVGLIYLLGNDRERVVNRTDYSELASSL